LSEQKEAEISDKIAVLAECVKGNRRAEVGGQSNQRTEIGMTRAKKRA
jgi:hypothetical protein